MWYNSGRISYLQALKQNTGWTVEASKWEASTASRGRLKAESDIIARKLENGGIAAFEPNSEVWAVGELSGQAELVDAGYRHIHLIPVVAQKDRWQLVRELEFFLKNSLHGRYARYAVITSGQRVPFFGDLRRQRQSHIKNINRWSSEAREKFSVEVIFRSDEATFKRSEVAGTSGVHLHSNVVFYPRRKLKKADWSRFLEWSKQRLGGVVWRDCGVLRDVREVVKYVCKLSWGECGLSESDVSDGQVGLDELTANELVWFHRETYRAKLVHALGAFANMRKTLAGWREKIVSVRSKSGEAVLRRVALPPSDPKPRASGGRRPENVIVGRTQPHPRFSNVYEPVSLVMNYTRSPETGLGETGLNIIEQRKRQAAKWSESFKVHNTTTTVQASSANNVDRPGRWRTCEKSGRMASSSLHEQAVFTAKYASTQNARVTREP